MNKLTKLRSLLVDLWVTFGGRFALLITLLVANGLLEGVTIATLIPLLSSMGVGDRAQGGVVTELAHAALASLGVEPAPISLAGLLLAILAAASTVFILQARLVTQMQTDYVLLWQHRLIDTMFAAGYGFFGRNRPGDLSSALINDVTRIGNAYYHCSLLLTAVIHSAIFIGVALILSGPLTLTVIIGGGSLFLLTRGLMRRAYRFGSGISERTADLQSLSGEFLNGVKMLKATATEDLAVDRLYRVTGDLREASFGSLFDLQRVKALFDFGSGVLVALVLVIGATVLSLPAASILVVLAIFVRMLPKATMIQQSLQSLGVTLPALDVLRRLTHDAAAQREDAADGVLPEPLRQGPIGITLRRVSVRHGATVSLNDIDLDVPAGAVVALVGPSGAGKTTLADAAIGLVPLAGGEVLLNGVPLAEVPIRALRRRSGLMPQETVVFDGSVRENILWGAPPEALGRLEEAARLASLDGVVAKLAQGYDTQVGARGSRLSGGERQRLGLARALVHAPGLLILDEATSALDAVTEKAVTDSIATLRGRSTILIIAHRLSSVRMADMICVLDKGEIVERGAWDDLMRRREGAFRRLWDLQTQGGAAEHTS